MTARSRQPFFGEVNDDLEDDQRIEMIIRELALKDRERQQQQLSKSNQQLSSPHLFKSSNQQRQYQQQRSHSQQQLMRSNQLSQQQFRLSCDQDQLVEQYEQSFYSRDQNQLTQSNEQLSSRPSCQLLRPSQLISQKISSVMRSEEEEFKPGFRPVVPRSQRLLMLQQQQQQPQEPQLLCSQEISNKRTFISVVETRVEAFGDPMER